MLTFVVNPQIIKRIETENKSSLVGPILEDYNHIFFKLSDLKKTNDLGGKGKGFGVRIENFEIDSINKKIEDIKLSTKRLTPSELLKYDWRIKIFLKKYGDEIPMEFISGPKKVLVYSPQIAKLISQKKLDMLQGPVLLGRNKKIYSISDLKMTEDYQVYEGFSTEASEIKSTLEQIQIAKNELGSSIIPIKIGSVIYDVTTIQKTQGSPKSDFHLLNNMNREIVWISHKDGKKPTDFQQWSGMTENGIIDDQEVKDFIESVKVIFPLGIDKGITVGRKISNDRLKLKSVYGVDYGGRFGKQNVTVVMQGPIDIESVGSHYKICSNHLLHNGEIPKDDYEPVMVAMYRSDRNQFNIKHARFAIYSKGGRIINDFI